ncbi:hypothetical protein QTO34_006587, partial [Cnephaeus nilssonii]
MAHYFQNLNFTNELQKKNVPVSSGLHGGAGRGGSLRSVALTAWQGGAAPGSRQARPRDPTCWRDLAHFADALRAMALPQVLLVGEGLWEVGSRTTFQMKLGLQGQRQAAAAARAESLARISCFGPLSGNPGRMSDYWLTGAGLSCNRTSLALPQKRERLLPPPLCLPAVYLADYGLAYRYCPNGNHKQYQENPRKGHNGTMEFTSLDAHKGVALSRRSDLEILGYCLLRWIGGELPWERSLQDPGAVQAAKTNLLDELPESVLKWAPSGSSCYEIAQYLACAHNLAYDEKPDYQMLKKILNPGGIPLGPLDFSTKEESINVRTPDYQKVGSQKAATKQGSQMQTRLMERSVHSERSAEPSATGRKVPKEEKRIGSRNKETAQESTRRRQKYCELQEFLNEVKSSPQKESFMQFPNSFYEPHQDFTHPDIFKSRCPSWYTCTSTAGMEVTDLSSTGFWSAISQFTL